MGDGDGGYKWEILNKMMKEGFPEVVYLYAMSDKNNAAICTSKGRIFWVQQSGRAK